MAQRLTQAGENERGNLVRLDPSVLFDLDPQICRACMQVEAAFFKCNSNTSMQVSPNPYCGLVLKRWECRVVSYQTLISPPRAHTTLQRCQNLEGCTIWCRVLVHKEFGCPQPTTNISGFKWTWGTGHELLVWQPREGRTRITGLKVTAYQPATGNYLSSLKPTVVPRR